MTILVDIDSTITNFGETLLSILNNKSKDRDEPTYKYTDISTYDWFDKIYVNPWQYANLHSFWDEVKINPEAVATLERWVKQGHKVYLVTASHFNSTLDYKIRKTLEPFNPELINERNIIIAQDKSAIMGDAMIDDCIDNLDNFNGLRICFAQPWNREYRGSRSCSWEAIDKIIQHTNFCFYEEDEVAF